MLKSALVTMAFAAGLAPSLSFANKQAMSKLMERSPLGPDPGDSPPLSVTPLLLYAAPLRVADAVAAMSRLAAVASAPARLTAGGRPALLRREEFAEQLRSAPAPMSPLLDWESGLELTPLSLRDREVTPLAIDACWTALSGGSPYCAPEELQRQLARWTPEPGRISLGTFERALLTGRATILSGYVVLFGIQALLVVVFVVPTLGGSG